MDTRLLSWIQGQASQAKGLHLSQLNPNTRLNTPCPFNVIQFRFKRKFVNQNVFPTQNHNDQENNWEWHLVNFSLVSGLLFFSLQPNVIKISELCKSIFAKLLSPIKTVTSLDWSFPVIAISDVTIHFNGWLKMGPTLPFIKR